MYEAANSMSQYLSQYVRVTCFTVLQYSLNMFMSMYIMCVIGDDPEFQRITDHFMTIRSKTNRLLIMTQSLKIYRTFNTIILYMLGKGCVLLVLHDVHVVHLFFFNSVCIQSLFKFANETYSY